MVAPATKKQDSTRCGPAPTTPDPASPDPGARRRHPSGPGGQSAPARRITAAPTHEEPMDFELTDEQKLIRETAQGVRRQGDRPPRPRERPQPPLRHRPGRARSPTRATSGAIVPREYGGAGLDYVTYGLIVEEVGRGLLGHAHGRLGADLAGVLVDPALGHRGAEAALPAQAVLGRVAGLLRPDRARHRLGRRQPADARQEDRRRLVDQRRQDVDLDGQPREGRAGVRPDRPGAQAPRAAPASWSTPTRTASPATEIHGKMGLHGSDTAAIDPGRRRGRPTTRCSARSATASRSR